MTWLRLIAVSVGALICGLPSVALALDPSQKLEQLHHTAWTAKEGLTGAANCLAQTADGFLWVGTTDGLFSFDGSQFERLRPQNADLPAGSVSALYALPDGGLWIGYQRGGVSFLDRDGRLVNYSDRDGLPVSRIRSFVRDHAGVIWVAAVGGVAFLEGQRWHRIRNAELNLAVRSAWWLAVDPQGTLWVMGASPNRIFFRRKGESHFQDFGVNTSGSARVVTADGTWLFPDAETDELQALSIGADRQPRLDTVIPLPFQQIALDRDGCLWLAGFDIVRISVADLLAARSGSRRGGRPVQPPIERFTHDQGLSGRIATGVLEDREGNIWVTTDGGLDRFRRRNLTWERRDQNPAAVVGLVAGDNGDVWTASTLAPTLRRVRDGSVVPNAPEPVVLTYRDPHGAIWLSTRTSVWRWSGGRFDAIAPPKESAERNIPPMVLAAAMDRTDRLWLSVGGIGQYYYKDGIWTFKTILEDRPDLTAIAAHVDDRDRVWLAYRDEIARVEGDKVRVFSARDGLANAPILLMAGHGQQLWVGGELGLAFLKDDRFHVVRSARYARFGTVTGILVRPGDGVWLHAGIGIIHISQAEVDKVVRDPSHPVKVELFDTLSDLPDQLHTRISGVPVTTAVESSDGLLWFMTSRGIARLDPRGVLRNPLAPPVWIRAMIADDRPYRLARRRDAAGPDEDDPDRLYGAEPVDPRTRRVPLSPRRMGNGLARRRFAAIGVLYAARAGRLSLSRHRLQQRWRVERDRRDGPVHHRDAVVPDAGGFSRS